MFDTPYINGCLREKMHLKRCTVHHTVDPTTMRIDTWTVRCAHIFVQVLVLYIFARRSFCMQICRLSEESGHQDILVWVAPEALQPDKGCTKASIITFAAQAGIIPPCRMVHPDRKETGWSNGTWEKMNPLDQCLAKFSKSCLEGCGWRSRGTKVFFYSYETSSFASDYQALVEGT